MIMKYELVLAPVKKRCLLLVYLRLTGNFCGVVRLEVSVNQLNCLDARFL